MIDYEEPHATAWTHAARYVAWWSAFARVGDRLLFVRHVYHFNDAGTLRKWHCILPNTQEVTLLWSRSAKFKSDGT